MDSGKRSMRISNALSKTFNSYQTSMVIGKNAKQTVHRSFFISLKFISYILMSKNDLEYTSALKFKSFEGVSTIQLHKSDSPLYLIKAFSAFDSLWF